MASSHLLCSQPRFSCNITYPTGPCKENVVSLFRASKLSSSLHRGARFGGTPLFLKLFCCNRINIGPIEMLYDSKHGNVEMKTYEVEKNDGASRLSLFSPCKINIFLRITSKRKDGFHELASLFHVTSLGDIISFSKSSSKTKDSLSSNVAGMPLDDRNLIIKALNLYRKKTDSDNYFMVDLDKKVPTGAGLGGGSSNAATALWAANQFMGCAATEKELQQWSGEIGSDVPFFFSTGAAYCTGRGEIVEDIFPPLPPSIPMVLIKPMESCSTAQVYNRVQMDETSKADPLMLLEKILSDGISQDVCINDLESPAFEVVPFLKTLKRRMGESGGYDAVFMSGSGSTIVGIGSPHPPGFLYNDHQQFQDAFFSEARFITRQLTYWYKKPTSASKL